MSFRPSPALIVLFLALGGCAPRAMIAQYGDGTGFEVPVAFLDTYGPAVDTYSAPMLPALGYPYPALVGQPQPFPAPAGVGGPTGRSHMPDAGLVPVFPPPPGKVPPRRKQ